MGLRSLFVSIFMVLLLLGSGAVRAAEQALDFDTVTMDIVDLGEFFIRNGHVAGLDAVADLQTGMDIAEIRQRLGEPDKILDTTEGEHVEYDFYMPLAHSDSSVVCQYALTFDDNHKLTVSGWRRPYCESQYHRYLESKKAQVADLYSVPSDVLFEFGEAVLTDLGKEAVSLAVERMNSAYREPVIQLVGYTDRVGSDESNLRLSNERAKAVFQFLTDRGVRYSEITYVGKGESDPVVECPGDENDPEVISCLRPNRRVEFRITENSNSATIFSAE